MRYNTEFVGDPPTEEVFDFIPCRTSELRVSSTPLRLLQRFGYGTTYMQNLYTSALRAFEGDFCFESQSERTAFIKFLLRNAGNGFWALFPYSIGRIEEADGYTLFIDSAVWSGYKGFEYFALLTDTTLKVLKPIEVSRDGNWTKVLLQAGLNDPPDPNTRVYLFTRFKLVNTEVNIDYLQKNKMVARGIRFRELPPDLQLGTP